MPSTIYARVATADGGDDPNSCKCGVRFESCRHPRTSCPDCDAVLCPRCFAGSLGGLYCVLTIVTFGFWKPARCLDCCDKVVRKKSFVVGGLPRLQEGTTFCYQGNEKTMQPGWLKLSADRANLEWASLRQILNRPQKSCSVPMVRIQTVDVKGQKITVHCDVGGSAKSWFKSKPQSVYCFEATTQPEAELWQQDLTDAVDFICPDLLTHQSDKDRLDVSRKRMEDRQRDRQRQLKELGNVGMTFTSEIMMTRK